MTTEKKIDLLKKLLGPEDETDSAILEAYLELAASKILNRMYQYEDFYETENMEIPERYVMNQLNICVYLLNKRGAEGEVQHIENGIHRNYGSSDIPDSMLKDVMPYCKGIK